MKKDELEMEMEEGLIIGLIIVLYIILFLLLIFTLFIYQDFEEKEEVIWMCEEVNVPLKGYRSVNGIILNLKPNTDYAIDYAIMENKFCEKVK